MTINTNPQDSAGRQASNSIERALIQSGVVSSAATQGGGAHHVVVQETTLPVDDPIPVLPTVHGDYYIPPEGSPVAVSPIKNGRYAVTNSLIPRTGAPQVAPGERIISHPLSRAAVKFNEDGSLDIYGDTTVRINEGSTGIITDVQATGTNEHGGITGLDITRNNNILI